MKYTTSNYKIDCYVEDLEIKVEEIKKKLKAATLKGIVDDSPETFEKYVGPTLNKINEVKQLQRLLEKYKGTALIKTDLDEEEQLINSLFLDDVY